MGKQQQPPQPVVAGVLSALCFSHLLWEWEEEVRRCGDEFMLQDPNSAPLIQTVTSELSAVEPLEVEKRHHWSQSESSALSAALLLVTCTPLLSGVLVPFLAELIL